MLPPVIDVEFYGSFSPSGVDPDALRKELRDMVDALTDRYAVKPILYVTEESRKALIGDRFDDCELWVRSVWFGKPNGRFTFWQYSDRAVLNGYRGMERCIDLNVFNGSEAEWAAYPGVPEP